MLDTHGRQFAYAYRCNSRASNLVIDLSRKETPIYHQMDMLINNNICGVLKMNLLLTDEKTSLYYDVTSKLTLAKFLGLRKLNRPELLNILLNITTTLRFCDGYLLYDRCFVFDDEFVFIDPSTLRTFLLYIPIDTETDFSENFKKLILKIITRLARLEDDPGDGNYVQRIIENLKTETFNIRDFREFLNGMIDETIQAKGGLDALDERYGDGYPDALSHEKILKQREMEEILRCRMKEKEKEMETGERDYGFPVKVFASVVIQVFILLICIAVKKHVELKDWSGSVLAGTAVILLALDVLILKKVLGGELLQRISKKRGVKPKGADGKDMKDGSFEPRGERTIAVGALEDESHRRCMNEEKWHSNETEVLKKTDHGVPVLRGFNEAKGEDIPIVKSGMIIGRLEEMVDYVSKNMSIGKVHAEVIYRDGEYYIKDLNSRNGTYINSEKVNSNTDYRIKNGDRITLANSDYEFIMP